MEKDLAISTIERQNVLNNKIAIEVIRGQLDVPAMFFDNQYCFTKQMVADFYEVGVSTIERYLTTYEDELKYNGYFLCKGKSLKEFKLQFGRLINEATKTTVIGLFNFRAFLNIGMLLSESEKAKQVRSLILDIVISCINGRTGGGTKYINRRDADYLPSAVAEVKYRKTLTSAIGRYVDGHPFQQPHLIDARTKMASRDLGFRDALHYNIAEYVKVLSPEEFDRFIGEKSIDFDTILEENKEVLKRLKQAENE